MQIDKSSFTSVVELVKAFASSGKGRVGNEERELEARYTSTLSRQRFVDVLRYFRSSSHASSQSSSSFSETHGVDVTVQTGDNDTFRVTYPSLLALKTTDAEETQRLPMIRKLRTHAPADLPEYHLRVNLKEEQDIGTQAVGLRAMIADALMSPDTNKVIRDKQRFSVPASDDAFRYDLTAVRQTTTRAPCGSDIVRGKMIASEESYEAEVEYVGPRSDREEEIAEQAVGAEVSSDDVKERQQQSEDDVGSGNARRLSLRLLKTASLLLKVVEDEDHLIPLSEKRAVLHEYGELLGLRKDDVEGRRMIAAQLEKEGGGKRALNMAKRGDGDPSAPPFIAPKPVTLTKENVLFPPVPGVLSVLRGYTVTEKADGERRMLFVAKSGRTYTINDRMTVSFTGIFSNGPKCTLLDGEFLPARKRASSLTAPSEATAQASEMKRAGGAKSKQTTAPASTSARDNDRNGSSPKRPSAAAAATDGHRRRRVSSSKQSTQSTGAREHVPGNSSTTAETAATAATATTPPLFLCFDVFFLGGKDVRDLPLLDRRPGQVTRVSIAERFVNDDGFRKMDASDCDVRVKKFYPVDSQAELFARANTVFRERDAGLFPYDIDGLIFTPASAAVGQDVAPSTTPSSDKSHLQPRPTNKRFMGGTWRSVLKWKPPEMNTIDFLVRFHDDDLVTGDDGAVFRVVDLYVGRTVTAQPLSILAALAGKNPFAQQQQRRRDPTSRESEYVAVKFQPDGEGADVHKAYLLTDEEGRVVVPRTGDEISDSVVAEFALNTGPKYQNVEVPFRWTPLRVRHDKTQKYVSSGRKEVTANNHNTAQQVWDSIHDPVTEDMLRGRDLPAMRSDAASYEMDRQQRYYVRDKARDKRASLPMLDFHNAWVKERSLLGAFAGHVSSLFDVGSGEGGDIQKWRRMPGLKRVLGIDYDKFNIVNPSSGAYARLARPQPSAVSDPTIVFFPLDAGKPLDVARINALPDPEDRLVGRVLWGADKSPELPSDLHGFASRPFDLVSCQFAVHYFFKDPFTLRTFAANLASVLRDGGYVVGTCMDGAAVEQELVSAGQMSAFGNVTKTGDKSAMNIQGVGEDGTLMWHVQKLYDGRMADAPIADRTGYKIRVYVESIGHVVDEFLVDFELLDAVMSDVGLERATPDALGLLGLPGSTGGFADLFESMRDHAAGERVSDHRITNALSMTDAHKRYSFLNRWFVYQKKPEK